MSIIWMEFDNRLKKSEIVMPLVSTSTEEVGANYSNKGLTDRAQTSVFGIISPLVMINNTVIDFDAVDSFELDSTGILPSVKMTVIDKYESLTNIDKPDYNSEIRVQILPRFENAYKKIDLTFYIDSISMRGKYVTLSGSYKLPALTVTQLTALGKKTTYNLFKTVALTTGLGFATNVESTPDARYIYCNNTSLLSTLNNEISKSDVSEHILDWWVDLWDNINLVDIKERYNAVDADEDMLIWVAGDISNTSAEVTTDAHEIIATINNHPAFANSELFVKDYRAIVNTATQIGGGTDKILSIYGEEARDYDDYFLQDGDVKNELSKVFEYAGEYYGDYNYLFAEKMRNTYMRKMFAEEIKVSLKTPLLALMRGHKVNFIRYINDDLIENKMKTLEDAGFIDRNVQSNIDLSNYEIDNGSQDGQFRMDKTASGQYLITGVRIRYYAQEWDYELTMIKPPSTKVNILTVERPEEETNIDTSSVTSMLNSIGSLLN